jgi:EAL domain-containing protein (putative c-di-GMP-specific phosphodiesterase class I)
LFHDRAAAVEELLKRADLAMYQAKAAGRNAIRFFDPAMQAAVMARSELEAELRSGLKHDEFVLHYQPQVDATGRVVAVEALARWQHPKRGLVSPLEFIALAEETGLIVPLGRPLLRQACDQLSAWSKDPATAHLSMSVNVSPQQFHHEAFVDMVLGVVQSSRAQPDRLVLEITEGLLLDHREENVAKMHELRSKGIRFSIDDFGTGYSSLAYLKRLPLDELKIDRAFVADIEQDENAAAICATFIHLARILGLRVVAEGVETEAQRHFLSTLYNCDVMQGYLFSQPVPASELVNLLN